MKKRTFINEKGDSFTFTGTSKKDIKTCLETIPEHWKEVKHFDILEYKTIIMALSIATVIYCIIMMM